MKRKQGENKAELENNVVAIEVVSDQDMATVAGGREWGWWQIQPTNVGYSGYSSGWGGGYSGGYSGGWGGYGGGWY